MSVIMATYNRAYCISPAIESIINQTYKNWELIVVDDQSADNTEKVVREFIAGNCKIKYLKLDKNLGCSGARNQGMKIATGDFITFLDSDDEYDKRKIEAQVNCFLKSSNKNLAVVSCGAIDFMDGKEYNRRMPEKKSNYYLSLLEKRKKIGAGSPFLMIKSEIIQKDNYYFDSEMPAMIDWDFVVRITKKYDFTFVKEYLVFVNHHSNDRMYNSKSAIKAIELQYQKYHSWLLDEPSAHLRFVKHASALMAHHQSIDKGIIFLNKNNTSFTKKTYRFELLLHKAALYLFGIKYFKLGYLKFLNN